MRAIVATAAAHLRHLDRRALAATLTVPVAVAGVLAWAFGGGLVSHGEGSAVAAIVNDDRPVTVRGRIVPLGRQIAAELVDGHDRRYTWVLTNDADARDGLASGEYAAVVTVPPTFSQRATSAATASDPLTAGQGTVTVTTARDAALADTLLSRDVTDAAVATLNAQVVGTYLDNVYLGFTTMRTRLGSASDGATRLADGTAQLSSGGNDLRDGGNALVVGLGQLAGGATRAHRGAIDLAAGADRLTTGNAQLAAGVDELATGTDRLTTGATRLAVGLDQARARTRQLPAQTRRLADGARQVADGNRRVADTVAPVADKVIQVIDAVPELTPRARRLQQLVARCRDVLASAGPPPGRTDADAVQFCRQLEQAVGTLVTGSRTIDTNKASLRGQAVGLRNGVTALAHGSEQVADGTAELARRTPALTRGVAAAAEGSHQLRAGAAKTRAGAHRLARGARQAADGSADIASGIGRLGTGLGELATGSGRAEQDVRAVAVGAGQLARGATRAQHGADALARGLGTARGSVPAYTAAQRAHLSEVAATPALTRAAGTARSGGLSASFFVVLALWLGGLAAFLARRPVHPRALGSRRSTWTLLTRAAAPVVAASAVAGLVLGIGMGAWLHLGAGRGAAVAAVTVAVAVSFTALNQALAAAVGVGGRIASLAVLVVTTAVGLLSTVPASLRSLAATLPTGDALVALRAVTVGGDRLPAALTGLAVWTLAAVLVAVHATERRRAATPTACPPARYDHPQEHAAGNSPSG